MRVSSTDDSWVAALGLFLRTYESRQTFSVDTVRKCLSDKSWLFLGDSTMSEVMHDLALFLSATHGANETLDYFSRATRFPGAGVNSPIENTYVLKKGIHERETTGTWTTMAKESMHFPGC